MKSTGVIRKIDELGRIVLPKEIRRNLGIRDGENLEIFVENDSIILKKYSKIADNNEIIQNLGGLVENTYDFKILITDRDKILYSTEPKISTSLNLSDELLKLIHNRESVVKESLQAYKFSDEELKGYFLIYPIISSIDCLGLIIFYDVNKNIPSYYLNFAKFLSSIIIEKIDIT